ncbi:MAG TPA: tryptophan synthase subunit alpha [Dehalococcoidia bacterium]|nr:tryptophan synthase subunit alpha [Dehalococcoidia bacterium]
MTSRVAAAFAKAKAENRLALVTHVIPGYPSTAETPGIFDAMVEGGADLIEVQIPFSDPLADGTTVQRGVFEALDNGTTPSDCIEFARAARSRHPDVAIIYMGYLNPVLAYGVERFARDAAAAGGDAIILVDLPPEEAAATRAAFAREGIDLIFLVAPTSSDHRLQLVAAQAAGFVYCVSVAGVTGARSDLPPDLRDFVGRVRRCTPLPLAVGFGISRREHITALAGVADGAVIGSATMDLINSRAPADRASAVREYVETLSGHRSASGTPQS